MKNKITNLIGLVFIGLAIYDVIYTDWQIWELVVLVIIGLSLWVFSNDKLQGIIKDIIGKKSNSIRHRVGGELPKSDDKKPLV